MLQTESIPVKYHPFRARYIKGCLKLLAFMVKNTIHYCLSNFSYDGMKTHAFINVIVSPTLMWAF